MTTSDSRSRRVVIAGGGPAALETALALQSLAAEPVSIMLVAPNADLVYRPLAVASPFGGGPPRRFSVRGLAAERGFAFHEAAVAGVEPQKREVITTDGEAIAYDALVLALGARPVESVPGATTFSGPADVAAVHDGLQRLRGGASSRVAFVAGPGTAWTLPIYELALMTAAWAAEHGIALEPWLVTHEPRPLGVFGGQASVEVAELLEQAGVRLWTGAEAAAVEDGRLWMDMEGGLPVDLAVALPRFVGRPVPGLPHDADGFVPVDALGRVAGVRDVYAVGDMTTRPLKQGGLATQQADATATALAAWAGADVKPVRYTPQLRAVLLTGREPRYLRRGGMAVEAPWWPPHKIAAKHLAPYLAAHPELEVEGARA
jgi:sulfide:quinone oxidoreductase